jgi:hypothetical protein
MSQVTIRRYSSRLRLDIRILQRSLAQEDYHRPCVIGRRKLTDAGRVVGLLAEYGPPPRLQAARWPAHARPGKEAACQGQPARPAAGHVLAGALPLAAGRRLGRRAGV